MEAVILLQRCSQTRRTFANRVEERAPGKWYKNWAFPIKDSRAKNEGYDKSVIRGMLYAADGKTPRRIRTRRKEPQNETKDPCSAAVHAATAGHCRSRRWGGAGLGVSICRAIADAHGATLEYESQKGEGTTATLRFL